MTQPTETHTYEVTHYDLALTLGSGQILRSRPLPDSRHEVASGGRVAMVWQEAAREGVPIAVRSVLRVECDAGEEPYWRRVLAIDDDYDRVWEALSDLHNPTMDAALAAYDGIRVLHMEPFEAFVTSVITQNNNVPRIRACVERICSPVGGDGDGTQVGDGTGRLDPFPDATELVERLEVGGKVLGLGYRLPYLTGLCEAWEAGSFDGMVARSVNRMPFDEGEVASCAEDMAELLRIKGIGPKVASCCCLFGLGHASAVPVDVWIKRLERDYDMPWVPEIAGIQQQYAFEWIRTLGK